MPGSKNRADVHDYITLRCKHKNSSRTLDVAFLAMRIQKEHILAQQPAMASFDDIAAFVKAQAGYGGAITASTSLQDDIRMYGDDIHDFLEAYAKRFNVDMSAYRWYFHTGEEGFGLGGLFFRPPNERVDPIPITIGMLYDFAIAGRWTLSYPPHEEPGFRPDVLINWIFAVAILVLLAGLFVRWLDS